MAPMTGAQSEPLAEPSAKPLLRALGGERLERPPWWLMRQAGRYLPEYRALRAQMPDFVEFCLNPVLAAEATLKPVRCWSRSRKRRASDSFGWKGWHCGLNRFARRSGAAVLPYHRRRR